MEKGIEIIPVGNDFAVLDVETTDFAQNSRRSSEELSNDGELGLGVDSLARAIKVGVALAVRVEVTSIRVTVTSIAVGRVGSSAGISGAAVLSRVDARMRSVSSRDGVSLCAMC